MVDQMESRLAEGSVVMWVFVMDVLTAELTAVKLVEQKGSYWVSMSVSLTAD